MLPGRGWGMRRVLGAVCVVAGLVGMSGCTPPDLPLVAVRIGEDRKPVAELRTCAGLDAAMVELHSWPEDEEDDDVAAEEEPSEMTPSSPTGSGAQEDSGWVTRGYVPGRVSFPLFSPPLSWNAEHTGRQVLLPGRTYVLSFRGAQDGGETYVGNVYFTADELASLRPGQVWADSRAMDRDTFDERADNTC